MNSKEGADILREIIRISLRKQGLLQKRETSCCGITITQCHALIEIGRADELTTNDCAELLNLDKSTISRTLDSMVKQGLVKRIENPDDRRYVKLMLTAEGHKMFTMINHNMDEYYNKIISAIPSEKLNAVLGTLPFLLKAIIDTEMFKENCDYKL